MSDRLVTAKINLAAYGRNLARLRTYLSPKTRVMAVLKANAYGHGAIALAHAAQSNNIDYIGVVCLYEARELRQAGIKLPILILNYLDPDSLIEAIDLDCEVTVMEEEVIQTLGALKKPVKIHLKVDTGMHRAGALPSEVIKLAKLVRSYPSLTLQGLFTHFASSDSEDLSFARTQLKVFNQVIFDLKQSGIVVPLIHASNSAATLTLPEAHFDMVRPGIASYGLSPFSAAHPFAENFASEFTPILSLTTQIVQVKHIETGESVGYGRQFIATRPTRIGLLPVGYGDGFRRAPNNWKFVMCKGKKLPILGRVSMDQTTIDLTDEASVGIHDEITLLGDTVSADEVASNMGTINYEVVTSLASRISREYIH